MSNLRIIDVSTGELQTDGSVYIRHKRQDEYYRNNTRDNRHFSFTHMRNIKEITEGLSNVYCGYIVTLQPYIEWETNILSHKGKPLHRADFAKILGVSSRTVSNVLRELVDFGVLFAESGYFRINERYHFRKHAGAEADVLIKTFFTALKRFNVKPADLGFVYKLLPYVHFETNVICADPFEANPQSVRFLNERQIAELVDMSADRASKTLDRLRKAGVVGRWHGDDKRENLTVLNPYVFYRRQGKPDATLRTLFSAHVFEG